MDGSLYLEIEDVLKKRESDFRTLFSGGSVSPEWDHSVVFSVVKNRN